MSTLEIIVEDLKALPPPKLEETAALIRRLRETTYAERLAALERTAGVWSGPEGEAIEKAIAEGCDGVRAERLAALRRSALILSEADGAELERIIEEGCERIDPRAW